MSNNKQLLRFVNYFFSGLIIFLIFPFCYAQTEIKDTPFEKKYFKKKKKHKLKEALYNLRKGDAAVKYENDYKKALIYYRKANRFNPNNASLNLKMAHSYQNQIKPDTAKIIAHFEKAYQLNPDAEEGQITYHLARIYHLNWHWDDAIKFYKRHLLVYQGDEKHVKVKEVKRHIQECENGKLAPKWQVSFDDLGHKLNSFYDEFAPIFSQNNDIVYFTAQKKGGTGWHIDDLIHYEDIYYSKKINGNWTRPRNLSLPVNTSGHDALSSISADGKRILIYRGDKEGDIYESKFGKKTWNEAIKLPAPINTKYRETTACYSPNGNTLYFVSNRPDKSLGGLDIFMSKKDKSGNWSVPVNLGSSVNTEYDEEGIYLLPSGKTMYFSSKGHNSIGGYDIYKTELIDGKWTKAKHLPIPVNTPDDDVYIWVSSDEKQIAYGTHPFFANNPRGNRDIYVLNLIGEEKIIPLDTEDELISSNDTEFSKTLSLDDDSVTIAKINTNLSGGESDNKENNNDNNSTGRDIAVNTNNISNNDTDTSNGNNKSETSKIKDNLSEGNTNNTNKSDKNDSNNSEKVNNESLTTGLIIFAGKILDAETKKPVKAEVIVNNLKTYKEHIYNTKAGKGNFNFKVEGNYNYGIAVKSSGYMMHSENITLSKNNRSKVILMRKMTKGGDIVLNNIQFDYNDTNLKPSSIEELKHLIHLLEENPNLKIEISGHTDNIGSASFNQQLSFERAEIVYLHLLDAGIEKERLTYKGYGYSKPIANNNSQKGRNKNRRTEFKIIEY